MRTSSKSACTTTHLRARLRDSARQNPGAAESSPSKSKQPDGRQPNNGPDAHPRPPRRGPHARARAGPSGNVVRPAQRSSLCRRVCGLGKPVLAHRNRSLGRSPAHDRLGRAREPPTVRQQAPASPSECERRERLVRRDCWSSVATASPNYASPLLLPPSSSVSTPAPVDSLRCPDSREAAAPAYAALTRGGPSNFHLELPTSGTWRTRI